MHSELNLALCIKPKQLCLQNNEECVPGSEGRCQLGGQEGSEGICGQEGSDGRGQAAGHVGRGKLFVNDARVGHCQAAGQLGRGIDGQLFPDAYLNESNYV